MCRSSGHQEACGAAKLALQTAVDFRGFAWATWKGHGHRRRRLHRYHRHHCNRRMLHQYNQPSSSWGRGRHRRPQVHLQTSIHSGDRIFRFHLSLNGCRRTHLPHLWAHLPLGDQIPYMKTTGMDSTGSILFADWTAWDSMGSAAQSSARTHVSTGAENLGGTNTSKGSSYMRGTIST